MSLAIWFWLFYVIGFLFWGYEGYSNRTAWPRGIIAAILFFIIGMALFGSPVQGTR